MQGCRAVLQLLSCCSELGGIPSFPLPHGVSLGEGSLGTGAVPFSGETRLLGADVMLLGGRGVTTSRNSHTRDQHGAEQQGRRQGLQPPAQSCSQHIKAFRAEKQSITLEPSSVPLKAALSPCSDPDLTFCHMLRLLHRKSV